MRPRTDLLELLEDMIEFLDNYVDVEDADYGEVRPNKAMQLATRCEIAISELEGL